MKIKIRLSTSEDIPGLQKIADDTELFPGELLPDMIHDYLSGEVAENLWITAEENEKVVGFCYLILEALTDRTWNMLVIAVDSAFQGKGIGQKILSEAEDILRKREQRILIVDTSGSEQFSETRKFLLDKIHNLIVCFNLFDFHRGLRNIFPKFGIMSIENSRSPTFQIT